MSHHVVFLLSFLSYVFSASAVPPRPNLSLPLPPLLAKRIGEAERPGPQGNAAAASSAAYSSHHLPEASHTHCRVADPKSDCFDEDWADDWSWIHEEACFTAADAEFDVNAAAYCNMVGTEECDAWGVDCHTAADTAASATALEGWAADTGLTMEQLEVWRSIETKQGLSIRKSTAPPAGPKGSQTPDPSRADSGFIEFPAFAGHLSGFHFGMGNRG